MSAAHSTLAPRRAGLVGLLADRKVNTKILMAVLVAAFIAAGVEVFAVVEMGSLNRSTSTMAEYTQQMRTIGDMRTFFNRASTDSLNHFLADTPSAKAEHEAAFRANEKALEDAETKFRSADLGPSRTKALADFDQAWQRYSTIVNDQLLPLSRAGRLAEIARITDAQVDPLVISMRESLTALADETTAVADQGKQTAASGYSSARTLTIALMIAALLLGVAAAIGIARLITRPLARCVDDPGTDPGRRPDRPHRADRSRRGRPAGRGAGRLHRRHGRHGPPGRRQRSSRRGRLGGAVQRGHPDVLGGGGDLRPGRQRRHRGR